jgi:hypothetical protein
VHRSKGTIVSRTLGLALLFLACSVAHAHAAAAVAYDFEDGVVPNPDSLMPNKVPATILAEPGGNRFLRMTATPEDCGPRFNTTCPWTRAELWIGGAPVTVNQTVTYSFSIRIPAADNPSGQDNVLWQLFQGYRIDPNGGRTIWLGVRDGRVYVGNDAGGMARRMDVGPLQYDVWVKYSVVVHLSDDPSGRVDVYADGQHIGSLVGQPTVLFGAYVSDMFLNVVDFGGVRGTADFDDVRISVDAQGHRDQPAADDRAGEHGPPT